MEILICFARVRQLAERIKELCQPGASLTISLANAAAAAADEHTRQHANCLC